jgi:hypothetical protein
MAMWQGYRNLLGEDAFGGMPSHYRVGSLIGQFEQHNHSEIDIRNYNEQLISFHRSINGFIYNIFFILFVAFKSLATLSPSGNTVRESVYLFSTYRREQAKPCIYGLTTAAL